jgi:Calcineurin-like phosphoesterase
MSDPGRWRDGDDGAPDAARRLLRRASPSRRMTRGERARTRARLSSLGLGTARVPKARAATWAVVLGASVGAFGLLVLSLADRQGVSSTLQARGPSGTSVSPGGGARAASIPRSGPTPRAVATTIAAGAEASAENEGSASEGPAQGKVRGGTYDTLNFAIVGDTRPVSVDDTAGYPKTIIEKIWQDVEAFSPRPAFTVTTGDYMFANASGSEAGPQVDLYLAARSAFSNVVFPALGNHECTGATASNCGAGNKDGITTNYSVFLTKMLAPLGLTKPYYTVEVGSTNHTWTAKFVFVAANAWDAAQASWLDSELRKATTYTFVVRHEGRSATEAPGVAPSQAIMERHPYSLLLVGHAHTFDYHASDRQVIVGNGGAPLSGSVNYGYVVAQQRADGAIVFKALDYATNAVVATFTVKEDGTPAPSG